MNVKQVFAELDVETYRRHALHHGERDWPQTNCYVDLWIEVLHARGLPSEAALGFTLTQDFEGDQFTFFKFPLEDLETLFDIRVQELAIFETIEVHVLRQIARGRLSLVEVDGYYLPDTAGVSHRLEHTKTTIAINQLDRAGRRLDYFHNDGFFTLAGEDYDGLFGHLPSQSAQTDRLFPYVEFVKFSDSRTPDPQLADRALDNLKRHLARRPHDNPVLAWRQVVDADIRSLAQKTPDAFHKYAFNTARQVGANFELLAAHLDWLNMQGALDFGAARASAAALSSAAKSLQFQLARAVNRKRFDGLEALLDPLAMHYDATMRALRDQLVG